MPIRTITAAGGNFGSASTWVEGVVPTSADDVVGDATSGNLTIPSIAYTINSLNLLNYLSVLSFSASTAGALAITTTASFSPTMSIISKNSGLTTRCLRFTGTGIQAIIPNSATFASVQMSGGTKRLFYPNGATGAPMNFDQRYNNDMGITLPSTANNASFTFDTANYEGQYNFIMGGLYNNAQTITIQPGSTFSWLGRTSWQGSNIRGYVRFECGAEPHFNYVSYRSSGTLANPLIFQYISGQMDQSQNVNINSGNGVKFTSNSNAYTTFRTGGMTWSTFWLNDTADGTYDLQERLNINDLQYFVRSSTTTNFQGSNGFNCNTFQVNKNSIGNFGNTEFIFTNGLTYSFGETIITGIAGSYSSPQIILRAATSSGAKVNCLFNGSPDMYNVDLKDLENKSGTAYLLGSKNILTRVVGFTTSAPSGAAATTGYTWVN